MKRRACAELVILCCVLLILSFFGGMSCGAHSVRVEAVRAGAAKWVPDEYGNNTLVWLSTCEAIP